MKARDQLIAFLRHARSNPDEHYAFDVEGDIHAGMAYVQRMRVELSNMRKELKLQGKNVRRFSMRVGCYAPYHRIDPSNPAKTTEWQRITLIYGEDATFRLDESVNELANLITHDLAS